MNKDHKLNFKFLGQDKVIVCVVEDLVNKKLGIGLSCCADEDKDFFSIRFGMRLAHTRAEYDLYKHLELKKKAREKGKEVYKMIEDFDKVVQLMKLKRKEEKE